MAAIDDSLDDLLHCFRQEAEVKPDVLPAEKPKLEWDKENNCITFGNAKFDKYCNFKDRKAWVNAVLHQNGSYVGYCHPKERNKKITDALGCSTVKLYNHFNKLQYKVFVAPYADVLAKVAYRPKRINVQALNAITKNWDVVKQVKEDGLINLLPIVAFTGKTPAELKKEWKGKWKVLANNSLNKNKAIVKHRSDMFPEIAHIPTTVLETANRVRGGYYTDAESLEYIANNFKGKWSDRKLVRQELDYFIDTQRMARQLDKKVDPKWSARRLREEHDKMSAEITARKYSKDKFPSMENIPVKRLEFEGYVATLLDSAFLIADEGTAMGHCVGGYADMARRGEYLVYSITKDGERSSTLGIYARKEQVVIRVFPIEAARVPHYNHDYKTTYSFNQHYGRFNTVLKDENEIEIARKILTELNKENKDG